jgi:hypothetical protein
MAGNFSVRRQAALAVGGFDVNFIGAAFRFETEFCRRLLRETGRRNLFDPRASCRHLKVPSGGIRVYGEKCRSSAIEHHLGDFYFAYREATGLERWTYIIYRVFRLVRTAYYAKHPWRIPSYFVTQVRSFFAARHLYHASVSHAQQHRLHD